MVCSMTFNCMKCSFYCIPSDKVNEIFNDGNNMMISHEGKIIFLWKLKFVR